MIDLLDRMHANGELQKLIDAGLVSGTVEIWRGMYHGYLAELKHTGSKMQAMSNTADNSGVSIQTVRYVRSRFEN